MPRAQLSVGSGVALLVAHELQAMPQGTGWEVYDDEYDEGVL